MLLKKITKMYGLPNELYFDVLKALQYDQTQTLEDINKLVELLPNKLKTRVVLKIYEKTYDQIHYLKNKSETFLSWICPMLKANHHAVDHYIYYETDIIDSIHFLTKGKAGYVLPIRKNIVFVEVESGDDFG